MKSTNRNLMLFNGTIMLLFLGLIYAWSIFREPLIEMFPNWSRTQISMTFTISMFCFCLGMFLSGKIAGKIKPRFVIMISSLIILSGFSMITLLLDANNPHKSLIVLYIFYGIFSGIGVGLSYNTIVGVVTGLFTDKPGFASGILLLGYGIGALALGALAEYFANSIGIRHTFLALGIILAVVLVIGSFSIYIPEKNSRDAKALEGAENLVAEPVEECEASARQYTLKEALSEFIFWAIFLWLIIMSVGGLLVVNSAAQIAIYYGAPATMGLIVVVFSGFGRPVLGVIYDKVGKNKSLMLITSILFLGGVILLIGDITHSAIFIFIGLPLVGIAFGGLPTWASAAINSCYGAKFFQIIFGTMSFALATAALIGPLLSSRLQELDNGNFRSSFIMLMIVGMCAYLVSFIFIKVSNKRK